MLLFWVCQRMPNIGNDQIRISRDDRGDRDAR
jgi:hypothetical protein